MWLPLNKHVNLKTYQLYNWIVYISLHYIISSLNVVRFCIESRAPTIVLLPSDAVTSRVLAGAGELGAVKLKVVLTNLLHEIRILRVCSLWEVVLFCWETLCIMRCENTIGWNCYFPISVNHGLAKKMTSTENSYNWRNRFTKINSLSPSFLNGVISRDDTL